jgi:urease beta subunit
MVNEYVSSGEGYFHRKGDPSNGCYGIPLEIEKERNMEWYAELLTQKKQDKLRIIKALKLIKNHHTHDINYKIDFLRKLGYSKVKIKKGEIKFENITKKNISNISRMYERTIFGLKEIIKHPEKESKLVQRLDSLQ